MDLEKIEGLVKILENSSLTEMTVKTGDIKITMSKLDHPPVVAAGGMPPMMIRRRERLPRVRQRQRKRRRKKTLSRISHLRSSEHSTRRRHRTLRRSSRSETM